MQNIIHDNYDIKDDFIMRREDPLLIPKYKVYIYIYIQTTTSNRPLMYVIGQQVWLGVSEGVTRYNHRGKCTRVGVVFKSFIATPRFV